MATVSLDIAKLQGMADAKAVRGLQSAVLRSEAILKADLLNQPGTGRIYKRGKGRVHQASAPGATPARDTGALANKTQADTQIRRDGADLVGRVVENTEYAAKLELGTERMAARPHLSKLKSDHADDLMRAFVEGAKG